jgi:hypothetical protein
MSPPVLVGSYPTVSPITCDLRYAAFAVIAEPSAGLFSVALVVGSPRLAVSQFVALRCSDFPLAHRIILKSRSEDYSGASNRPTHSKEPTRV